MNVDYDANGNTTQLGFQSMTYNDADRLTSVIQKNPLTGDNVKKMEYEYDGLSRRRVSTTYTWNAGTQTWTQQDERHFIYDGMDLIQERDGSNTVIASYVRDGNIGGVLSRTTSSGTFYYHYDGNGNVVAMTNISGAIVAQYTYDAYGNLTSMSGAEAASNPIRFSTKYFDTNTGYYDFGFRSYEPITGRWLNRDPMGEAGGLNLYGFVGNSPGNIVDPYGLDGIVNIYGTDSGVEKWGGTFQIMKPLVIYHNGKLLTQTSLYKPTRKEAVNALLHADAFYFWGHGSYNGAIRINDSESISLSTLKWIAQTRKKWGLSKMAFAHLDSCGSAESAEVVNTWLEFANKFTGHPYLTFYTGNHGKFGFGKTFTTSRPINYDPSPRGANK